MQRRKHGTGAGKVPASDVMNSRWDLSRRASGSGTTANTFLTSYAAWGSQTVLSRGRSQETPDSVSVSIGACKFLLCDANFPAHDAEMPHASRPLQCRVPSRYSGPHEYGPSLFSGRSSCGPAIAAHVPRYPTHPPYLNSDFRTPDHLNFTQHVLT